MRLLHIGYTAAIMPSPVTYPASNSPGTPLPAAFYVRPAPELARALIGMQLLVNGVGGRVVETEAYDRDDPASHTFNSQTARNAAISGHLTVCSNRTPTNLQTKFTMMPPAGVDISQNLGWVMRL